MPAVEQWARSLLAEMETLSVSGDPGPNKRNRVAAVSDKGKKDKGTPPKAEPSARKIDAPPKDACKHWATEAGCRRGRNCAFAHTLDKPGKCWVCGGGHHKSECQAPGGGKGPIPDAKPKGKAIPQAPKDAGPKGGGKTPAAKAQAAASSEASSVLKEATQLLQSLRLSKMQPSMPTSNLLKRMVETNGTRGLIDGGATACLRTAERTELGLPRVPVQLAAGECHLHVNHAGTLLSPKPVAPIVSFSALLRLGYAMKWSDRTCEIVHPQYGKLEVDTSSGCPEVSTEVALDLIKRYEALVGKKQVREGKINKMMHDMASFTKAQLAETIRQEGSDAEAALRLLLSRVFKLLPSECLDQLVVPVQEVQVGTTWNRRTRLRHAKSKGILLHVFCGESRGAFESTASRQGLSHLAVDLKEDLLKQGTYQHLILEAVRGNIKMVAGGPQMTCCISDICACSWWQPSVADRQACRTLDLRLNSQRIQKGGQVKEWTEVFTKHGTCKSIAPMKDLHRFGALRSGMLWKQSMACNSYISIRGPYSMQNESPPRWPLIWLLIHV